MRSLRIAFVVHDYNRSWGHSRYVAELASRFQHSHDVHVFANTIDPGGEDTRIHFHHVPAWRLNAFTTVLSFIAPATWAVRGRFDIVHAQGVCGLRQNVVTVHQCNREWHAARKRTAGRLAWRETLFGTVASTLEARLYTNVPASSVIAISHRTADDIARHYDCSRPRHVIYHGVDTDIFTPCAREPWRIETRQAWGVDPREFTYLFVGDLRKGAHQCIRALGDLPDGRLVLVSRTPPGEYRALADQLGVAPRVTFAGASNQVERCYAAADAFLLPTPYDPFALVVTEAMAAGLPVVVSRDAGASELITPGVTGLVLEDPADVRELRRAMQWLAVDRSRACGMGQAACDAMRQHTWDAVAEETLAVYAAVAKG